MNKSPRPEATDADPQPILEDQLGLNDSSGAEPQDVSSAEEKNPLLEETSDEKPAAESSPAEELTDGLAKPKKTELRPWYKRPKLMGILAGAVIVVVLIVLGLWSMAAGRQDRSFVSQQWGKIKTSSDRVADSANLASYATFSDVSKSLSDMNATLEDSGTAAKSRSTFLGDGASVKALKDLVNEIKTYNDKAKQLTSNMDGVKDEDIAALKDLATATKLKVNDANAAQEAIDGDLSPGYYTLNERIDTVISAHRNNEDQKKAKEDEVKSKAEQAKQDQADAEESVSRWTQAYIAGSVADMKKYMTSAFAKEYDFTSVTSTYRTYNYPTTYRRVSTEKKGEQFEVLQTITYVSKSDYSADSTYTLNTILLVTQDATSKKWLLNSQRNQ